MTDEITITRRSDADIPFTFKQSDGEPLVIQAPVEVFADSVLGERATATIVDASLGKVNVFIEGTIPIPTGKYGLRVVVTRADGNTFGTPEVTVNVV